MPVTIMLKFLNRLSGRSDSEPQPDQLTINSYQEQDCGVELKDIQAVMKWLSLSLYAAHYTGCSHIFWLHEEEAPGPLHRQLRQIDRKAEPIFAYRCGDRLPAPPPDYYWRLMAEHTSLRVYQLEVRDSE